MKDITYVSTNVIRNYSPGKSHICIMVHSNLCCGIFLFIQKYSLGKSLKCQYVTKVKVGVLRPVQQPGSYWDRSTELPLVGLEPTEVTAYD